MYSYDPPSVQTISSQMGRVAQLIARHLPYLDCSYEYAVVSCWFIVGVSADPGAWTAEGLNLLDSQGLELSGMRCN